MPPLLASPAARPWVLLLALGAAAAHAGEPPAWGTIDEAERARGRFVLRVASPPADGRIPLPHGFAQVTRATLAGTDGPLPIEVDARTADRTLILPPAPDAAPRTVVVEVTDGTRQYADGRFVLAARDALVTGRTAKLESQPGSDRIGFWTDATDTVSWKPRLTRWGRYEVLLTYATAAPDGTEIGVDLGPAKLAAALPSTGGWYRYRTLSLGTVTLPSAGDLPVVVRCTRKAGDAVMNLAALTLLPTCEGEPPVQAADGTIMLHGRDATVRGTVLRYEPAPQKQTLGYWTRPGDAAVWTFVVTQPGSFDVEVLQGCGTGQGGSRMRVLLQKVSESGGLPTGGEDSLAFTVEDTGGFQVFRPRVIGRVTLAVGRHTLRIQPEKIAKAAACDIRQVRLLPVPLVP